MPRPVLILVVAALVVAAIGAVPLATGEVVQKGNLRLSVEGGITPHRLPRVGRVPIAVTLAGRIKTTNGQPPQLRTIEMAISRQGRFDFKGVPRCGLHQVQPATTAEALQACADSLVGRGSFEANVALPEQSPFPSNGAMLAFNGALGGRPVIFVHIYGTRPLPQSFTLTFRPHRGRGRYGTTLVAQLPRVAADWGFVSGISLTLGRSYVHRGQRRGFISAGCPAPKGFSAATIGFAKAAFGFEDGRTLESTLVRSCEVGSFRDRNVPPQREL